MVVAAIDDCDLDTLQQYQLQNVESNFIIPSACISSDYSTEKVSLNCMFILKYIPDKTGGINT